MVKTVVASANVRLVENVPEMTPVLVFNVMPAGNADVLEKFTPLPSGSTTTIVAHVWAVCSAKLPRELLAPVTK